MRAVNHSSKGGGLTCSFVDREVTMFFQFNNKHLSRNLLYRLLAVIQLVMEKSLSGCLIETFISMMKAIRLTMHTLSSYVWISHLVKGQRIAPETSKLAIYLPLSTSSPFDVSAENNGT